MISKITLRPRLIPKTTSLAVESQVFSSENMFFSNKIYTSLPSEFISWDFPGFLPNGKNCSENIFRIGSSFNSFEIEGSEMIKMFRDE